MSKLGIFRHHLSPRHVGLGRKGLSFRLGIRPRTLRLSDYDAVHFGSLRFRPCLQMRPPDRLVTSVRRPLFPTGRLFGSLPRKLFRGLRKVHIRKRLTCSFRLSTSLTHPSDLGFCSSLHPRRFQVLNCKAAGLNGVSRRFRCATCRGRVPMHAFPIKPS